MAEAPAFPALSGLVCTPRAGNSGGSGKELRACKSAQAFLITWDCFSLIILYVYLALCDIYLLHTYILAQVV